MPVLLVVDSGTTNTRVRLWDGERVAAAASEPVGARNTAMDGHNGAVRAAPGRPIGQVVAAGSPGPAGQAAHAMGPGPGPGPADLARLIVRHDFPDIAPYPFYFIPGIKTLPATPDNLRETDILRGEEAEAAGLPELLGLHGPAMLMHYGSHHKAIYLDGEGRIQFSRTAITGELLMAIAGNTVLKSSVVGPAELTEPDPAMWRAGLADAQTDGLGRALFLVRVAEQIWKQSKADVTSYLLGALTSLDLPLLNGAREAGAAVLLYGKGHFPPILKACLDEQGWPDVRLVDEATAELASAVGAARIYAQMVGCR